MFIYFVRNCVKISPLQLIKLQNLLKDKLIIKFGYTLISFIIIFFVLFISLIKIRILWF